MRVRLRCIIEYTPVANEHADQQHEDEAHGSSPLARGAPLWVRDARWPSTMITTPITSR